MFSRKLGALLGAVTVLMPAWIAVPASAQPSRHVSSRRGCDTGADDFDGNGGTDLAIGAPGTRHGGRVYVKMKTRQGIRTLVLHPPGGKSTDRAFGTSVGDVDLSRHVRASAPCSNLVVGDEGRIYIYAYREHVHNFVLLHVIRGSDIAPGLKGFGSVQTTQVEPGDRTAARRPVLYVGAPEATVDARKNVGAVVRLVLTPTGRVASSRIITPRAEPTRQMPLTQSDATFFGRVLAGTPFPDEVLIGVDNATVEGIDNAGAVLDWHRAGTSSLITENSPGVPGKPTNAGGFGHSLFVSVAVSAQTHTPTALLVGTRKESVVQLHFRDHGARGSIDTHAARLWTQASKGVAGKPGSDGFGAAMEAVVGSRGKPLFLVSAPDKKLSGNQPRGVVYTLGTGQAFKAARLHVRTIGDPENFGATMADWHDRTDRLADDPWPQSTPQGWAHRVLAAASSVGDIVAGLPINGAGRTRHFRIPRGECKTHHFLACGYGSAMTYGTGGGAGDS